jgi:hypothetical protein
LKKLIALVTVFAFVAMLAGVVAAQVDTRTPAEKIEAGRAYLKLLDQKIIRLRKEGKTKLVAQAQVDKKATIARMQGWKAEMEAQAAPPPPPRPVAPVAPAAPKQAASAGLFGWGLNTSLTGGWINTGKGSLSGSGMILGNVVLDDFVGLGPMVGLSEKAVKFTLGAGGVYGGGGMKAIPVLAGGIINLPADMMGGLETYLVGGLNYVVTGNGNTSGRLGGSAGVGVNCDLGLGLGKTGFELGWAAYCSHTHTSKGITLAVSQPIGL